MKQRTIAVVFVILFAFALSGCNNRTETTQATAPTPSVVQAATTPAVAPDPPHDWHDGATVRVLDTYVNPETKIRATSVQDLETHEAFIVRCVTHDGPAGIACRQPKKTIKYTLTASPKWYDHGCDDGSYYMTPVGSGDDHFDGKTLNVCLHREVRKTN